MPDDLLNITDESDGSVILADSLLSQDADQRINLATYRRSRDSGTGPGAIPVWRLRRQRGEEALTKLAVIASDYPELHSIFIAVAKVIRLRPDDVRLTPQQIARFAPEHMTLPQLILALSGMVAQGLLEKGYAIADPETGRISAKVFRTLEEIPDILDDDSLGRFPVRQGKIVDVYERTI